MNDIYLYTLKCLRAEIIAIERAFPELRLPQRRRTVRRSLTNVTTRTRKLSAGSAQGDVRADETVLGGTAEGAGEGEVVASSHGALSSGEDTWSGPDSL